MANTAIVKVLNSHRGPILLPTEKGKPAFTIAPGTAKEGPQISEVPKGVWDAAKKLGAVKHLLDTNQLREI